jgi:hypothetical protein
MFIIRHREGTPGKAVHTSADVKSTSRVLASPLATALVALI